MIEQLIEMMKEVNESEEVFEQGALMMKNAYDALVKVGFTEEQAITIVAGQGAGIKQG